LPFVLQCAALACALGLADPALALEGRQLRSPDDGAVRALVIGIDAYQHVRQLKGAVADAQDIDGALRRSGVGDVTTLIDARADRASVLSAIQGLVARAGRGDLVILSLAGHGSQEPDKVHGTHPDGYEDVFLLAGFENAGTGTRERILAAEFNHFIKQFEARGAHVLFIADTCYGGGMTRDVDPRAEEMSFRQVPRYRLADDWLEPVATTEDELTAGSAVDFDRTVFLAAVDRRTKAPEVQIPNVPGWRGALSFAVARAIDGAAGGTRGDVAPTLRDFFGNIRQVVYQLSSQRQNIVTDASPAMNPTTDVIFRSVATGQQVAGAPSPMAPASTGADRPIRIAAWDGKKEHFAGLGKREAAFEAVDVRDNPDLIWDFAKSEVIDGAGDAVAFRLDPRDLPIVVDRTAAIRQLERIEQTKAQEIQIDNDRRHNEGEIIHIQLTDVGQRALILFNIAGNGAVQMLYPAKPTDDRIIRSASFELQLRVQEPFGGDNLVAVTSQQPMPQLEQALNGIMNERRPIEVIKQINRFKPADARIGFAGLYTAPQTYGKQAQDDERSVRIIEAPGVSPANASPAQRLPETAGPPTLTPAVPSAGQIPTLTPPPVASLPVAPPVASPPPVASLPVAPPMGVAEAPPPAAPAPGAVPVRPPAAPSNSVVYSNPAVPVLTPAQPARPSPQDTPRPYNEARPPGVLPPPPAALPSPPAALPPPTEIAKLPRPNQTARPPDLDAAVKVPNPAGLAMQILPGPDLAVGSEVSFQISSKKPGYLILLDVEADGKLIQIYPTPMSLRAPSARLREKMNYVRPGTTIRIPDRQNAFSGFNFVASPPFGTAMVVAILSDRPVQMVDLPDVPLSMLGSASAADFLTRLASELRIPGANGTRLEAPHWSFDVKFYAIR
jgi:hypothetical protein